MKYAIVTGGSSGIGLGIVKMLLKRGYHVFITYAFDDNIEEVKNKLEEISAFFEFFEIDQSNRNMTYYFINEIKKRTSSIDCVICNAGITRRNAFVNFKDDDWDAMLEVALNSHFIIIRELFSLISKNSRILFTGSLMGIRPHGTVLCYGVVKAAVHALAKNLVKEFDDTGTTVNVIAPGFVETPWQKKKPNEVRQNIYMKTAIHRFASIEEIVSAFEFCIDNDFVNGSIIEVSGGYSYK